MKDYFGYEGKTCIVTGASSGMGRATAEMLVDLGAKVYALDLKSCDVPGIEGFVQCNLSSKASVDEAFAQLPKAQRFFGVAGLSGSKTDYMTTFNCDFTANKHIVQTYLADMEPGGAIVFVASTAGLNWKQYKREQDKVVHAGGWEEVEALVRPLADVAPSTMAYLYAKRCISQFACEQAVELGRQGIRVCTVMPGSTDTGMKDEFEKMAGGPEALLAEAGVAGRLATSEEMAGPIVFLGSDMASFVSGVDLCVDFADSCLKTLKLKKDREDVPAANKLVLRLAKRAMEKS